MNDYFKDKKIKFLKELETRMMESTNVEVLEKEGIFTSNGISSSKTPNGSYTFTVKINGGARNS